MSTYNAKLLAKQAAEYLNHLADKNKPHLDTVSFLDGSNNNLGGVKFPEESLNAIRVLTHVAKGIGQKTLSFSDAITEAEKNPAIGKQGVEKLKDAEAFADHFKVLTGMDVVHFSDSQFDIPTAQQLGWSYNSNTQYNDPRWHTVGKPRNAFVETFQRDIIGGIPYTTEYIRTNFYQIEGSTSDFNVQQGVIDQADLNQIVTHANYLTRTWGMKITPRNKWVTDRMEVQGIPDFAYARAGYWMELRQDDHMAYGDPRSDIFGIENCEAATIDLSTLGNIAGLGDGIYEATAFTFVWKAIVSSIVQTPANYRKLITKIIFPKNIYQYLAILERSYIATAANTNNVGSIPSNRRFLAELSDMLSILNMGANVEIIMGPAEMQNTLIFWKYDSQTFPEIEWYMSPTVGNVTATFEGAPANYSTEMVVTMSEIIQRNSDNMIRVKLPDSGNFNVIRREYILSGSANTNPIVVNSTPVAAPAAIAKTEKKAS